MKNSDTPVLISVRNIRKNFGITEALGGVTLEFSAGFMHGIIGPEGAGKTTLLRIILGLLKPTGGKVFFFRAGRQTELEEIRSGMAYLPQQQSLYSDLSVGEHLEFFKELYGLSEPLYQSKREELLHITRLEAFVDRPAGLLSGGMYKKLGLICALLRSPDVLVLDEPTNGVDPISRREFWDLLYRLLEQKILILMTTSYMDEAERCGRVHLLEGGEVVIEGEPRDLLKNSKMRNFDELFINKVADD